LKVYLNGDYYMGDLENDKRHSYDTEKEQDSFGRMVYASGDVYVGQWAHDVKSFNGNMTYANGDVYRGGWVND